MRLMAVCSIENLGWVARGVGVDAVLGVVVHWMPLSLVVVKVDVLGVVVSVPVRGRFRMSA